ncbi:MAG: GDP-mannose 4,6-dehydratase [Dehalococcoidia bacterium]|nr:GDP-mannose 4,6-dehydratase [Dehalococcoidia bacterium]
MTGTQKALITGIGGFVGVYLTEYLLEQGVEVHGIVRPADSAFIVGLYGDRIGLTYADLMDSVAVTLAMQEVEPDLIFHLAAQASVFLSWQDPAATLTNNTIGQLNLLLGVIEAGINPRILILGSNEVYGLVTADELPISEANDLRPINPYAVSKVAQDMLGYQYFASHKLQCVRVRPFNHIGPRQTDAFVVAAFARQVAEAEAGLREPVVKVGNLSASRDFTDVRDIVRAYHLALARGESGAVYNIGSGRAVSIEWILEFLVSQSKVPVAVQVDPERFRPVDQPVTVCDSSKFTKQTGWTPQIPLETTLVDTLDHWRQMVRQSGGPKKA